jgi:excisionase family DNA binding protein
MTGDLLKKDGIEEKNEIEYKKDVLFFENRVEREWLGTLEAASFLRMSENALRIMVYRGQIPVYKFGRRLRFRKSDLCSLFTKKGA